MFVSRIMSQELLNVLNPAPRFEPESSEVGERCICFSIRQTWQIGGYNVFMRVKTETACYRYKII